MSFKDIRGQERQLGILREAMYTGRLAGSYLFSGPEGIGKSMIARKLAMALNCLKLKDDACEECASCKKIANNTHPDIHVIAPVDSSVIKIEQVQELQRSMGLKPYEAKRKAFIIDNAHLLSAEAQNALLKVLEEPVKDSLIILISAKPQLLFKTIISRCQRLKFSPFKRSELQGILKESYSFDASLAHYLAYSCEGKLGLAIGLKESDPLTHKNRIIDSFINTKSNSADSFFASDKNELREALNILTQWFRDIYLLKTGVMHSELINLDRKNDLLKLMQKFSFSEIEEILGCISDSIGYLSQNINTKLMLANLKAHMEVG